MRSRLKKLVPPELRELLQFLETADLQAASAFEEEHENCKSGSEDDPKDVENVLALCDDSQVLTQSTWRQRRRFQPTGIQGRRGEVVSGVSVYMCIRLVMGLRHIGIFQQV